MEVSFGKGKTDNQKELDYVIFDDDGIAKGMNGNEWVGMDMDVLQDCYRIVIGWNRDVVNLTLINETKQSVFCLVEAVNMPFKSYCTIVYAANSGSERKNLWSDLNRHNHIANGDPWFIGGDFNVTLKAAKDSCGSSLMTSDMHDFNDCINQIIVEDICSTGLNFTWIKNLHKVKQGDFSGIL
ncbi:RNA-directed DNA polymerase, eukaryota, reverse transcriptase zinc-binding domain protein [Tanacetum coccineum]